MFKSANRPLQKSKQRKTNIPRISLHCSAGIKKIKFDISNINFFTICRGLQKKRQAFIELKNSLNGVTGNVW